VKTKPRQPNDLAALACIAKLAKVSPNRAAKALGGHGASPATTTATLKRALSALGVEPARRTLPVKGEALAKTGHDAAVWVETEHGGRWAVWRGRAHELVDPMGQAGGQPRAWLPVYLRRAPLRASADWRARDLLNEVCEVAGEPSLIDEARADFARRGLAKAVRVHDDETIFDWLVEVLGFQGVSDQAARTYWRSGGGVTYRGVTTGLAGAGCPKLQGFFSFDRCGFRKTAASCSEPDRLVACPLPRHDLRNGRLNQSAYALRLFFRDRCADDFVGWIDRQLASAEQGPRRSRPARLAKAVVGPMKAIFGLADKILCMALSDFLIAADPDRPLWVAAGGSMIAVDTLVHNWLHRTGLLAAFGLDHRYGSACYGAAGCAVLLRRLAGQVDARRVNPAYPKVFPRFVQHAIWRFCAQDHDGRCNGVRIDDRKRCGDRACPLRHACARVRLNRPS
jgi:hypothetical protein